MNNLKVCAVIVTYNRKKLLEECLDAIIGQTRKIDKIIIIDNASTDGTSELINNKFLPTGIIQYIKQNKNLGGAGGFYEGFKEASSQSFDFIWIMDDDTIPTNKALENLLKANETLEANHEKISFLASAIFAINGDPDNVPTISRKTASNGNSNWYNYLDNGIVKIDTATFVSLLIKVDAIKKCGLPCRDYFIWGDDTEFTTRLTTFYGDAYFVGDSKVVHKRANNKAFNIMNEIDKKRLRNYHYAFRNNLINARYYRGYKAFLKDYIIYTRNAWKALFSKLGFSKFHQVTKGKFEYFFMYRKFKKYIDKQLGK